MSLREEIAKEFDNCMGFHEGIRVPDYEKGHRAIDYADKVMKLIEKRIDIVLEEKSKYHDDYAEGLYRLQRLLK